MSVVDHRILVSVARLRERPLYVDPTALAGSRHLSYLSVE